VNSDFVKPIAQLLDLALLRAGLFFSELVFTKLILQISYWFYKMAIYSRVFMDLPINVDTYVKSILFLFGGELRCS
jgi:hypothetical protein